MAASLLHFTSCKPGQDYGVRLLLTCMMGSMSSFQRAWLSSEVRASHSVLFGQCMK